jgi:hypothetical protein
VYSWVVWRRVLLDGVALLGFNGDLALFLHFGNSASRLAAAPVPGNYSPMRLANAATRQLNGPNIARSTRADAPAARPKHIGSFHLAHSHAGARSDESRPNSRTFITLLDLGVSHVARLL